MPGCRARTLDLIVTMDDATSAIYSAFLDAGGRDRLDLPGVGGGVPAHGLPIEPLHRPWQPLFHTPEAGRRWIAERPTQVGRALAHLGVEHIAAYSPQARGRSERMFQTLQDRLVKELRLAGAIFHGIGTPLRG